MCLPCGTLKTPPKSSVPPSLPIRNRRNLSTRSESTLPQLLIPLHFKPFRCNVYKKPGRGSHLPAPKFGNSSLATGCLCVCPALSATRFLFKRLLHGSLDTQGGGYLRPTPLRLLNLPLSTDDCQLSSATMPTASRSHPCLNLFLPSFCAPSF
jgi:hypothetical protein